MGASDLAGPDDASLLGPLDEVADADMPEYQLSA